MATYDDPRILRAIAHPARNRILSELHASGSLRAADVARTLDIPANQASFHLRQLAKYGLVEEAPEEARDKRDRVWRMAAADGITISTAQMYAHPGGPAAMEVYLQHSRAWGHLLVDRAQAKGRAQTQTQSQDDTESDAEGDAAEHPPVRIVDGALHLTAQEVEEFGEEFTALLERWRERTLGHDDGRTTYSIYQIVQPYPDLPDGESSNQTGDEPEDRA